VLNLILIDSLNFYEILWFILLINLIRIATFNNPVLIRMKFVHLFENILQFLSLVEIRVQILNCFYRNFEIPQHAIVLHNFNLRALHFKNYFNNYMNLY